MISHIVREVFPFGVPRIERGPKDPTHSVFGKKLRMVKNAPRVARPTHAGRYALLGQWAPSSRSPSRAT